MTMTPCQNCERLLVPLRTAAKMLGVSWMHLRKLSVERGEIPYLRLSNRIMFSVNTLREWIAANEVREPGRRARTNGQ